MPSHTRLYRRGAVYYHRAAVPQDIAATYGKREETFSLKTRDHAEAVRRVRVAAVEVDQKFDEHRLWLARQKGPALDQLSSEQIATIKAVYLHHLLDEDEEVRLDGFEELEGEDDILRLSSPQQFDPRPTFEEQAELVAEMAAFNRANYARGKSDPFLRDEAEEILSWDGIDLKLDPNSASWAKLMRALQEAAIEAADATKRRNSGDIVPTPEHPLVEGKSTAKPTPLLSTAVKLWTEEKSRVAWSPKVHNDHVAWIDLFIEIVGDRPIETYRKDDVRAFKDILMKLPANARKKPETRGLPARAAAEKAVQLDLTPMSVSNVNKALNRVGAFWNWAEAHYDNVPSGLMKGLKLKAAVAARDQREPFSPGQIAALFSSPLFTGCRSERYCSQPGTHLMASTARYWLPLLGLFTGARLNELCQLTPTDVKELDGIAYLDITNESEDQRIKTATGKRRIPLHSQLLAFGFLEFVDQRKRQGSAQLFPELKRDKAGYFSGDFSKFFSRHLERIGIKTAKTSFHSFRHNFEDACRNNEIPPNIMNALQGHAERGMAGRYGDGNFRIDLLKGHIERLRFPRLDLSEINGFR